MASKLRTHPPLTLFPIPRSPPLHIYAPHDINQSIMYGGEAFWMEKGN